MCGTLFDPEDIPAELRDCFEEVEVQCGAPWVRETERVGEVPQTARRKNLIATHRSVSTCNGGVNRSTLGAGVGGDVPATVRRTLGFRPGCSCDAGPPVGAVVFDPFGGAMTTAVVALALGRRAVATELSPEYLSLGRRRLERPHARMPKGGRDEVHPLFADHD